MTHPPIRAFSGVQPTGRLHLGNYLGAIKPWVERQHGRENLFCVVDLHALTIPEVIQPAKLRANCRNVVAAFLASGIDPAVSSIFVQSHVREHAELCWVLNCVTPLGWLDRMTQFKSKSEGRETIGAGLLDYPVLQAADILLYDTDVVPVGEDQKQHIELARDIATRFNHLFGDTLKVPAASIPPAGARVMGLDEPAVKMSKSIAEVRPNHAIHLDQDLGKARKAIMKAVTDAGCEYRPEQASPGVLNLMGILSAVAGETVESISARFEGRGYGALKAEVADAVIAELTPVQSHYQRLLADEGYLDGILSRSTDQARAIAQGVMGRVRGAVGIG